MKILETKSIYYDDVNLIAQPNDIISRKQVPTEFERIFVSPMPSVVGETFAKEALSLRLSVCLHRFCSVEDQVKLYSNLKDTVGDYNLWASVGLNDYDRVNQLKKWGCSKFVIDVANGYLENVVDFANQLSSKDDITKVMCGNIHSGLGYRLYHKLSKCDKIILRVGIGNGSGCDTATKATGYGRGQITEITECAKEKEGFSIFPRIIADGGIKNGSCAVKAFGAGADAVMLGGYFSKAEEAQNVIDGDFKFWGCASTYNQKKFGEVRRHSEGKVLEINKDEIVPLKELVNQLWGGISSGVSYSGYKSLQDFIGNGVFELKV